MTSKTIPFPAALPWGESPLSDSLAFAGWLARIPESIEILIVLPADDDIANVICPYTSGSTLAVTRPHYDGRVMPDGSFGADHTGDDVIAELLVTDVRCRPVAGITTSEAILAGATQCSIPECEDHPDLIGYMMGRDDRCSSLKKTPIDAFSSMWKSAHPDCPFDFAWAWFLTVVRRS